MNIVMQWTEATQAVEAAESILVVTHLGPDGDAIGSLLGMTLALRERGKTVDAAVDGGVPDKMRFLPGSDTVKSTLSEGDWDLMIAVDCGDEERTGLAGKYGMEHSKMVINIDHHPTNTLFGDVQLVASDAVSATEIIFHWLNRWGHRINRDVAMPLLNGLVTDTLCFRTNNVTAGTLNIAQQLMEAGASLTEITARSLNNKSYSALRLWKHVLPSVKMKAGVIAATITQNDLEQVGLTEATDGGLVSFMMKVNEAMIAVAFKERLDGRVELSLRARPGFDVAEVALALGGGGHTLASGAMVDGPLEDVKKQVMPMLRKAARKGRLVIA